MRKLTKLDVVVAELSSHRSFATQEADSVTSLIAFGDSLLTTK